MSNAWIIARQPAYLARPTDNSFYAIIFGRNGNGIVTTQIGVGNDLGCGAAGGAEQVFPAIWQFTIADTMKLNASPMWK